MIAITRKEREWFIRNIAYGLIEYMGTTNPPVEVEEMLQHPPPIYGFDFGVVDMYSNLWDATFARPPSRRGSIFVRINLPPDQRRFALAREILSALITSKHGQAMGLGDLLMENLQESAEYFARHLLVPEPMVKTYQVNGGDPIEIAEKFGIPLEVADKRMKDVCLEVF
jgi:GNAT superfamily N-acetyltransferase